ncbi:MAG: type VI secretion system tube protein Hcp [Luminiphilus sp.]|nr:type VI secretion system tube protein Hcp [Luminiphilus sp.]MDG1461166.1 type VI secretion system tube protein Hcp [Luminiphilus sp.]
MAVDAFLKLDGIDGESQDKEHKGEIDIIAWSWGGASTGSFDLGGGGASGKASFSDLSLTKYYDKASPNLMAKMADGTHIKEATLFARKAGGSSAIEFLKIKLSDVIITSVTFGGSGGEDRYTENVSIAFAKFEVAYQAQKNDGAKDGGEIKAGWDIQTNQSV